MGWLVGIEPTYVGITIRCVNHFAIATICLTRRGVVSLTEGSSVNND